MAKKIFIVDDADFMVEMLRVILREAGHTVVGIALNGEKALDAIRALPSASFPDIVTVDFHMPKMDGMATVSALRSLVPSVKVVLVSAHATLPLVMKAKEAGVDAFISKPFEPQTVLEAISKLG
ncbi:MAG: response regulator [Synergistaceae bacterium]|nr:response regulator [Synergistaceae bacterium]